ARWMGTCPSHFQNKEDNHNRNANYCIQLKNIRAKFFYQRRKLRHAILHRAFSFLTLPSLWKNHIIARAGQARPGSSFSSQRKRSGINIFNRIYETKSKKQKARKSA